MIKSGILRFVARWKSKILQRYFDFEWIEVRIIYRFYTGTGFCYYSFSRSKNAFQKFRTHITPSRY